MFPSLSLSLHYQCRAKPQARQANSACVCLILLFFRSFSTSLAAFAWRSLLLLPFFFVRPCDLEIVAGLDERRILSSSRPWNTKTRKYTRGDDDDDDHPCHCSRSRSLFSRSPPSLRSRNMMLLSLSLSLILSYTDAWHYCSTIYSVSLSVARRLHLFLLFFPIKFNSAPSVAQ